MKRQLTMGNHLEWCVGLLVPTIVFLPMLLLGLMGMLQRLMMGQVGAVEMLFIIFLSGIPLVALGLVWWLVLSGPDFFLRYPVLRWSAVLVGGLAFLIAGYGVWSAARMILSTLRPDGARPVATIIRINAPLLLLAGPMIVGAKYWLRLVRRIR